MFESVRRWAQSTVDRAIGEVVVRTIVVIPFLVAVGFGTAALSIRLNRELGPEMGMLVLAGGFAVLGLFAALVVRLRAPAAASSEDVVDGSAPNAEAVPGASETSSIDRELMMAALSSAAPLAVPSIIQLATRNLPLIAAVAAAVFVIARDNHGSDALEPGE